ncbi:MAG: CRISPR-associated ring nuclease [Promethearchaeota archaeon]
MVDVYVISTLGTSPGVITGIIDFLVEGDLGAYYYPKYIGIVTTDYDLTRRSIDVIKEDLDLNYSEIKLIPFIIDNISDIESVEDNFKVMREFITALKKGEDLKKNGEIEEIHVNISGGRKTMSGIFTSLSNIFPINIVYQLITTREIELQGNIKNFLTLSGEFDYEQVRSEEKQKILHPRKFQIASNLIEIPILHTIEIEELTEIAEKIMKGEPVSEKLL